MKSSKQAGKKLKYGDFQLRGSSIVYKPFVASFFHDGLISYVSGTRILTKNKKPYSHGIVADVFGRKKHPRNTLLTVIPKIKS